MKAVNLFLLTRNQDHSIMSSLYQALSDNKDFKRISPHEAACICKLTDLLTGCMKSSRATAREMLSLFDGFFFSYIIEHIGKEFDLLKFSSDGEYAVNIELKSEDIGEERIKKQLEQNRYYLAHTVHRIYSFTFVMSTGTFYFLNDKKYLRRSSVKELREVLCRPVFQNYLSEGIDRLFLSSDYLISPVAVPDSFLEGQYFLTNQQHDFKERVMEHIEAKPGAVISIIGNAGTGKTLLLFDLAMSFSRKDRVLIIHSGKLRKGHYVIRERLRNIDIQSAENTYGRKEDFSGYSYILVDEADHLSCDVLSRYLKQAKALGIPSILTYDPHELLCELFQEEQSSGTVECMKNESTLSLSFSGNIRINRPVYSFLRTILFPAEHPGHPDYGCIDILYAESMEDRAFLERYYIDRGYLLIHSNAEQGNEASVIAQEYYKVLMVLDSSFYYDNSHRLCTREGSGEKIRLLYEGLSRTRESLCLIIEGNQKLYEQILAIRLHRYRQEN